ncbi:MAG: hypothetical protein D6744_16005 [Planctomycetota bacterium]|nr:MAG: hypothetical protein D6744_16005 [Planctomycetota bacterium]
MSDDLNQLERSVQRELAELAPVLDTALPDPDALARVRGVVRAEAVRIRRRAVWRRRVAGSLAAAAALLLAVGLRLPSPPTGVDPLELVYADADPVELLEEWVDANYESSERFSALYNQTWCLTELDSDVDDADIESSLDDLERSFESFESLLGA